MRVLVVGTLPPPGGEAAIRLGAVAAELQSAGHAVELFSPDARSAAHHHGRLVGPLLAAQLVARARHFDALVLNVEPGLPLAPTADRLTRALTLGAIGLALGRYADVTVRLPSPIALPGGVGGRASRELWSRATKIVVESADDRDRVVAAPGASVDRIVVEAPPSAASMSGEDGWGRLSVTDGDLRTAVQALVRQRAARDRLVIGARAALGNAGSEDLPVDPFRGDVGRAPSPSAADLARLLFRRARRLGAQLLR